MAIGRIKSLAFRKNSLLFFNNKKRILIIIMSICMITISKLLFSMKHGIITIYIIDFLNRGIQDRHKEYTQYFCRITQGSIKYISLLI